MSQGHTPEEAASRLGVTTKTLRNWEAWGRIAPADRTEGGRRRYSEEALSLIEAANLVERGRKMRTSKKESGVTFIIPITVGLLQSISFPLDDDVFFV